MNRRKPRGEEGTKKLTNFFAASKQTGKNRVVEWEEEEDSPVITPTATLQPTLSGDVKYTESDLKRTLNAFTVLTTSSKRQKLQEAVEKQAEEQAKRKEIEAIDKNFYQHLSSRANRRRERKLDELRDDLETDEELLLADTKNDKRNFVFGRGVVNANLMVIFCKPTKDEMETKKAFSSGYAKVLFDQLRKQGIDPDLHCWFTYLMKIAPPRNWDPSYEEVQSHLPYLLKEIKIILPKQIICFGDIPVTLAYAHFQLNERMIGSVISEEACRFKTTSLWFVKRLGMAKTAVRFEQFDHIARVFMHSDVKFFMDAKEKINGQRIREEWLEHFIQLRQQLFLPPLVLTDPIIDLNAHFEAKGQGNIYDVAGRLGVHFSQPDEPIIRREQLHAIKKPENYLEWLGDRPFRLYIQTCRFDDHYNRYTLFTRTLEGFSCTLHVNDPVFHFWVYHGSFDRRVDGKGKIDYRPPDADELQRQINDMLTTSQAARFAKKGKTTQEMLDYLGVRVEFVLKRPYQYYHKKRIQFLEVKYKQHSVLYQVKEILNHLLPGYATFEARVKPTDFLFYERNLTAYGWVQVDRATLTEEPPETISDFEFTTTYAALFPTEGPDAPIRVFNFDGEMKKQEGSDKLPQPEDSAIIRLCCTLNDLNPHNRTPLYEIRRHAKAKKDRLRNKKRNQRETRYTGNTNIYQRVEFVVGPHELPTAEVFTPTVLPYIPLKPLRQLLNWQSTASTEFVESWYDWFTFINQVHTWVGWVGHHRAHLLFNHAYTSQCFLQGTLKSISKDQSRNEEIYNAWKDNVALLDIAWESRLHDDAVEELAYQPPEEAESELEIGNIQYRWKVFYPTPIVRFYDSEAAMLVAFAEYVREADVDLFVGHNICGFDIPFVIRRMHILNLRWLDYFSNRGDWPVALNRCLFTLDYSPTPSLRMDSVQAKKMETRANGARVLMLIDIPGRDTFDTLHYAQRDIADLHGFDLSSVASEVVGDVKHDVPHTSINPLFYNNPKKLTGICF
jgi:uracil-DNA glycosylase family 4